jgi:outer membrane protein TolC
MVADHRRQEVTTRAQYEAGEISRLDLDGIELQVALAELAAFDARVKAQEVVGQLEDAIESPAAFADWVTGVPAREPVAIKR